MKKLLYLCATALLPALLPTQHASGQVITSHYEQIDTFCGVSNFWVYTSGCTSGQTIDTYFGDGSVGTATVSCSGSSGWANMTHNYGVMGTYTVKHVLKSGGSPVDSVDTSFNHIFCTNMVIGQYADMNGNCVHDAGDYWMYMPVDIEVDSAGVPVDTISSLFGWGYSALGPVGTIYTFKVITPPAGMTVSCPSSAGIIYDTVPMPGFPVPVKYFGYTCTSSTAFDLSVFGSFRPALTGARGWATVMNTSCAGTAATLKMDFSPKYTFNSTLFTSCNPGIPHTVTGNSVSFTLGTVTNFLPVNIYTYFDPVGTLTLGDTTHTTYTVTPLTGDAVPSNNTITLIDTIRASMDPNAKAVMPEGDITAGTRLTYTLQFENDGNDTAHNIHIMDTLSNNLDINSLKLLNSTHAVTIVKLSTGTQNVLKFDFRNIMLPDSSHHDVCRGQVTFAINSKTGLAPGTVIPNRGGIYFDINEVVMTNTAYNRIPVLSLVQEMNKTFVDLYPNPVHDMLAINTDGNFSTAVISNAVGQVLYSQEMNSSRTINVKQLPAGIYLLTLKGTTGVTTRKFEKL